MLWSDVSKSEVLVRSREGEQMVSACVVPIVKLGGGGVMVWGCFAGNTDDNLFKTQSQHGYQALCSDMPPRPVCI